MKNLAYFIDYFEQHAQQKRIAYRKFGRVDPNRLSDEYKGKRFARSGRYNENLDEKRKGSDSTDSDSHSKRRKRDSFSATDDEDAETLESSDNSPEHDGELYESVFSMRSFDESSPAQ